VQYTSADVLFITQEVTGFFPAAHPVFLDTLIVLDKDDQALAWDLVFFRSDAAMGAAINATIAITDANADEIISVVEVAEADYVDLANSQIAVIPLSRAGMGIKLKPAIGGTSLYIGGIARGAPTHTASGITLKIGGTTL